VAWGANCGGETPCACGDTVTSSYTLTENLSCTNAGAALSQGANDITITLGSYTIDGDGTNTTNGIETKGFDGLTLTGDSSTYGIIKDFTTLAVYVSGGSQDVTVNYVKAQNIGDIGHSGIGFYMVGGYPTDPINNVIYNYCWADNISGNGFLAAHYTTNITYNNCKTTDSGKYFAAHGFSGYPYRQTFTSGWTFSNETLDSEIFINSDCEASSGGWSGYGTPVSIAQSDEQAHGGTYSWKIVANSSYDGMKQVISRVAGEIYKLSFWVYPIGSTTIYVQGRKADNSGSLYNFDITGLTENEWNYREYYFAETVTGSLGESTFFSSAASTLYFDDISVKNVTAGPVYKQTYLLSGSRIVNSTSSTALTENDGVTTAVGLNEWDTDGSDLYINVGNLNPNSLSIIVSDANHGPVTYNDCEVDGFYDSVKYGGGAYGGEGHAFAADDLASNYTYNFCGAKNFDGIGIHLNKGIGNKINNCTIDGSLYSSGILSNITSVLEIYNTISVNNASYGIFGGTNSTVTENYNDIYNNTSGARSNVSVGAHSIALDPLFVSATDFNLQPGSPCRNAGTPNGSTPYSSIVYDMLNRAITISDGQTAKYGSAIDIGAYEYIYEFEKITDFGFGFDF